MPVGVVQIIRDRVGGSAVSGVAVCRRVVQLVDAGRLGLVTRAPFVLPAARGGCAEGPGASPHARSAGVPARQRRAARRRRALSQ